MLSPRLSLLSNASLLHNHPHPGPLPRSTAGEGEETTVNAPGLHPSFPLPRVVALFAAVVGGAGGGGIGFAAEVADSVHVRRELLAI
jgi:hypothetical protein